jgi:hypothetical protein
MTEFQKIVTGLLGLTHPEIYVSGRNRALKEAPPEQKRPSEKLETNGARLDDNKQA